MNERVQLDPNDQVPEEPTTPFADASYAEQKVYESAYEAGKRMWENTVLKANNKELNHEATHDDLTGVLNRRGIEPILAERQQEAARTGRPFFLVFIDGTNVKAVNDKLNHEAGDEVIVGTAQVLEQSIREGDIIARIGGDEFVILPTAREGEDQNIDTSQQAMKQRIYEETQDYLQANPHYADLGFDIAVGTAIGQSHQTLEEIKIAAEEDMKQHKAEQHKANGQHRP